MTDEERQKLKKQQFQNQLFALIASALADELCPGCLVNTLVGAGVAICQMAKLTPAEMDRHDFGFLRVAAESPPSSATTSPPWVASRH